MTDLCDHHDAFRFSIKIHSLPFPFAQADCSIMSDLSASVFPYVCRVLLPFVVMLVVYDDIDESFIL